MFALILLFLILFVIVLYSFSDNKKSIPLKIFQTWYTKDLPLNMKNAVNKLKQQNPEFQHFLFDDNDCRNYIIKHFNKDVLYAFDKLIPGAFKADLWRYCVMYIEGGVYLDIKYYCEDGFSLKELINDNCLVRDRDDHFVNGSGIYNAFIVSFPENKIYKKLIERIVYNVKNNFYGYNSLYVTGPGLFGELYDSKKCKLYFNGNDSICKNNGQVIMRKYDLYNNDKYANNKKDYDYLWRLQNIYKEM
jgi:mannosyltransferase OCH1-like enzyme